MLSEEDGTGHDAVASLQKLKDEKRLSVLSEEDGTGHGVVLSLQNFKKGKRLSVLSEEVEVGIMLWPHSRI